MRQTTTNAYIHTCSQFRFNPACMFLGSGRKPEYRKRNSGMFKEEMQTSHRKAMQPALVPQILFSIPKAHTKMGELAF